MCLIQIELDIFIKGASPVLQLEVQVNIKNVHRQNIMLSRLNFVVQNLKDHFSRL